MKCRCSLFMCTILHFAGLMAQDYEVGQSYFSEMDYIEYIHGNLPIILSAPHGGYNKPAEIPDRDCSGCVYVMDAYTQELTREIAEIIFLQTGCHPYVIINRLHRDKLDANRSIVTGADGNPLGEKAWNDFHGYIEFAQAEVEEKIGFGLFLDMHGHGHEIQRLELGYLLSGDELKLDAEELNQENFVEDCSIAHLVGANIQNLSLSELLKGEQSFGSLIDAQSYPAVPSSGDPFPADDPYFTGGFNTASYGSRDGGVIDAIQIECNQEVRFTESERKLFAQEMASTIIEFMFLHYNDFDLCQMTGNLETDAINLRIFPNPVIDVLNVSGLAKGFSFNVYNSTGSLVFSRTDQAQIREIDLSSLPSGSYYLQMKNSDGNYAHSAFVKF